MVTRARYDARLGAKYGGAPKGSVGASSANTDTIKGYRLRTNALHTDKGAENMNNDMPGKVDVYNDDGTLPKRKSSKDWMFALGAGVAAYIITKLLT